MNDIGSMNEGKTGCYIFHDVPKLRHPCPGWDIMREIRDSRSNIRGPFAKNVIFQIEIAALHIDEIIRIRKHAVLIYGYNVLVKPVA